MIAIIDYGVGNLRSVEKAIEQVGGKSIVTADLQLLRQADAVILPGVGAFEEAMNKLEQSGTIDILREAINANKPFLGICLGMQMLFEYSEEGTGKVPGVGIFQGSVKKFTVEKCGQLKIPQIGWNNINIKSDNALLGQINNNEYFYFVHSYYVESNERSIVAATADYGFEFDAAIASGNVFATQFHPEKSGAVGLKLLKNFVALTQKEGGVENDHLSCN